MGIFQEYRARGWSVVPAKVGDKRPPVHWKKYQTAYPADTEIAKWDQDAEDRAGGTAQVGIITGSLSKIVVLDIDSPEGHRWLRDTKSHLPMTACVITSPGEEDEPDTRKVHYYFKHPGGMVENKVKFRPGMDLRADGGFVMAPPSLHKDGHRYAWAPGMHPDDVGIAKMPTWLLKAVCNRITVEISDADQLPPDKDINLDGVPKGERNATAARLTGRWFAMGLDEPEVLLLVSAWNQKNEPPLAEKEIEKVVQSISQREARSKAAKVGAGKAEPEKEKKYVIPWHEERAAMLIGLSKRLDIEILDIQKITGEDPLWKFTFPNGVSATMRTANIFNNQQFRIKIFEQAGKVLKPISNKKGDWDTVCQVINDAAEWIDSGDEATMAGEFRRAIEDYLANFRPEIWDDNNRPPMNYPFIFENVGYIFSGHLLNYLQNNKNMKIILRDLAQRLTGMAMVNQRKRINGYEIRVWSVPPEYLPPAPVAEGKDNVVPIKRF